MNFMFQSGIWSMLSGAPPVVKGVLFLLAGMSFVSWLIIFYKFLTLGRIKRNIIEDIAVFRLESTLDNAMGALFRREPSPSFKIAEQGRIGVEKILSSPLHPSVKFRLAKGVLKRALWQEVGTQITLLEKKLSFLAMCANSAPFIGLFGTVWGIMNAFHSIGLQKTAALAAVAPGISEALVATAIGLAVAIPASVAYNAFSATLAAIENYLKVFATAFLNQAEMEQSWLSASAKSDGKQYENRQDDIK